MSDVRRRSQPQDDNFFTWWRGKTYLEKVLTIIAMQFALVLFFIIVAFVTAP